MRAGEGDGGQPQQQQEETEDLWEHRYDFSSFSCTVMEEFASEACVGGTQWPGGVRLARYMDNTHAFPPGFWQGRRVLELGAGCGLVSAVLAKLGARVLATDKRIVLSHLQSNLESNEVFYGGGVEQEEEEEVLLPPAGSAAIQELQWGPNASHSEAPFDVVVAAACLYVPKTVPLLLETLWRLSGPKTLVLMAGIVGEGALEAFQAQVDGYFGVRVMDDGGVEVDDPTPGDVATRVMVLARKERGAGGRGGGGVGSQAGGGAISASAELSEKALMD